jgi:HD-like signal output (HDOD) protein
MWPDPRDVTMDYQGRKIQLWTAAMAADPDLYGVAARVATIPDVAAAVVRFANSAYVGAVYPVGTVLEAVIRIGCRSVGALAMASLNRELVDAWGAPEMWEESLIVGRAAKVIGRLEGLSRVESEHLFVAGLFSAAGAAALLARDDGFSGWRRQQWLKGLTDGQLLKREEMAFGENHVTAAANVLDEWNMPTEIVAVIATHHDPASPMERALWAAMTVVDDLSPVRCLDIPFAAAMGRIGLAAHVDFVGSEARLFADVAMQVMTEPDEHEAA